MEEKTKLETRIKQIEREKNINNTALFPSYNRNLRPVNGQPSFNRYKKARHTDRGFEEI